MVGGIAQSKVESTPRLDPSLGQPDSNQQDSRGKGRSAAGGGGGGGADTVKLSPEAQQQISQLQQRDREVRSHEQSHISAGGAHVNGGASYTYQRGPDNKQYAIGGSVSIDTSAEPGKPEATKAKARQVRSAALAPGNPSAQDQSVAAQASAMEMQAQQEVQEAKTEESQNARSQNIQGANSLQTKGLGAYTAGPGATTAGPGVYTAAPTAGPSATTAGPGVYTAAPTAGPGAPTAGPSATTADPTAGPGATTAAPTAARAASPEHNPALTSRAAAAYQLVQQQGSMPTALAPWGTGIAMTV